MKRIFLFLISVFIASTILAQYQFTIDFSSPVSIGSPFVFGATQPRGLSNEQWDVLQKQGFTFARSQADLSALVPCSSVEDYLGNKDNCNDPSTWDWEKGIYGKDFVKKASCRNMKTCLVFKNAVWNRHLNAPEDEETMPANLNIWADMLIKVIDHYQGDIDYIEFFNEVDRDPQFIVDGSGLSRKEAYQALVRKGLETIRRSAYPHTRAGGPAAANIGEEQIRWLLEDAYIRANMGCITFHDFDNPLFPDSAMGIYHGIRDEYQVQPHIIRSSFVPEFNRQGGYPGTLKSAHVAPHLIGALKNGLEACGLWEIQNKTDEDDVRYWFDGERCVQTAHLFHMMSVELGLGKGYSRIVQDNEGLNLLLGAINSEGEKLLVIANNSQTSSKVKLTIHGLPPGNLFMEFYSGTSEGQTERAVERALPGQRQLILNLDPEEVQGIKFIEK
jgi:hypothetical protein